MLLDVSALDALGGVPVGALVLIFVGFTIGFVSAIFGVGGGFFITPFLHSVVHLPAVLASATSLGQIPFMSLSGTFGYLKEGLIQLRPVLLFLLGSIPASQGIVYAMALFQRSAWASEPWLGRLTASDLVLLLSFSIFIGMQGIYNLKKAGEHGRSGESKNFQRWAVSRNKEALFLVLSGLLAGCFSALLGIGGGFFSFPVMVYVCGLTPAGAVASGLLAVFVTSLLALLQHIYHEQIYLVLSLMLAAGAIPGAFLGARRAVQLSPVLLLRSMGYMQLGIVVVYLSVKLSSGL
ncbi:MAG: sulfite exporter TauE/SafE family protein [Spirochaetales bacterium]|nr:sulfite exporter TauE/SafE family protein [Spirochaetales bacterium]